jgi:SAM-dependent methyltransferase
MQASEIERLAHFEEWYWWHRARQAIVSRLLARYGRSAQDRVLDVGCGAGATTLTLRGSGRVLGVDFGAEAVTAARGRGLEVARMDAGGLAVLDGAFDVVVALDVLEHLDDDAAAARELHRALRSGGRLLVTVPAYQWLWSSHDEALGHRRRYRRAQVRTLLEGAGLHVEVCAYVMTVALPPAVLIRMLERLRRGPRSAPRSESGYVRIPGFLNTLLTRIVGLDGVLAGRVPSPFGLSVVAVGQKREALATAPAA